MLSAYLIVVYNRITVDRITGLSARHERIPLKEPFEVAKRRAATSDAVLVELATAGGVAGFGAAVPVRYVTGESIRSVLSAVRKAAKVLVGRPALDFPSTSDDLARILPKDSSARAAIEMALFDAAGKLCGVPSYELFGGAPMSVETDITIPIVPPDHARELAARRAAEGFRLFKVKVGSKRPDEDAARARAVAEAVPAASLIVDANQGFRADQAISFAAQLRSAGVNIRLFEQPVDKSDLEGLARVSQSVDVPVFADESACSPSQVAQLAASRAVSGVNVKLMKAGILGALEIAAICQAEGLQLMLGCMLEPRIGITAALHVACAAGAFLHFDLDGDLLLDQESSGGFIRQGAWIRPIRAPGLGCPPAP